MRPWEPFGCINEINNQCLESHTGSGYPRTAPLRSRFGNKCHMINECHHSVESQGDNYSKMTRLKPHAQQRGKFRQ